MPKQDVIQLHPSGWETDADEERFKVSTIDRTPTVAYNHYVLFFRLDDGDKERAVGVLREGLELTLSQARYMCGTIERDAEGGHSFVKKKDSTVKMVVQWLDAPEDTDKYPSMEDMDKTCFSTHTLGDLSLWGIPNMLWGERPDADPDASPTVAAYQINLVRGGLVFSMHSHHYASDVMGWSNYTLQLADNCAAVARQTPRPEWDPACIDVSRFTIDVPEEALVDGPPLQHRHPGHPEQVALLFHLPQSKARQIKALARPDEGWVSTYDATCAYVWRMLSRVRAPLHKPDPDRPLWWAEAVNMRPRVAGLPARMMRNVVAGAFSDTAGIPEPTARDVISAAPLSALAVYIRRLTQSCTAEHLEALLRLIAPIRDKRSTSLHVDAHPPMSIFVTDHRPGDVSGFDFGFASPVTYRHYWGPLLTAGLILIYAPIRSAKNPDEGCVWTVTMEKELVPKLLEDPEWNRYFEYRGVD